MKKLVGFTIGGVVLLSVAVALAMALNAVGYPQGWFSPIGLKSQVTSARGGVAGGPHAGGQALPKGGGGAAGPAAQAAARQFDGNVAALAWGGNVESATGTADDNLGGHDNLLNLIDGDKDTFWMSLDEPGPKEIVMSFADHESVLIDRVTILIDASAAPSNTARDVEVWVSSTGPKQGFTRVATAALPGTGENTIRFDPVEARYVQLRLLHNQAGGEMFQISEVKVLESKRSGYTPLLARRPDLMGPQPSRGAGTAVPAAGTAPACVPLPPTPPPPGHGESNRVLVVAEIPWTHVDDATGGMYLKSHPDDLQKRPDLAAAGRADYTLVNVLRVRPWMLSPKVGYDTVVLEQLCEGRLPAEFKLALAPWVAEGHKLIIHDADKCSPGPDYSWLPYLFKTNNPGAQGAPGNFLRFMEENWMAHGHRGQPGYVDVAAWENSTDDYRNELGDTNTLIAWDPHWCGHMVIRNVNNIFGFFLIYGHYGRGLIIYDGSDIDMMGTAGHEILSARELAQGFDPDNLPCAARIGDFVVTTDTDLMERPFQPGRSYDYPLTLLSNQGYKGTVGLSVKANPGLDGMQANFAPASVGVDGLAEAKFSLTLPAGAPSTPQALQVKGVDAAGKTNTLCLQLVQPTSGELSVAPPPTTAEELKAEIDRHGRVTIYINFDFDKAIIKPESKPAVNEVIRMMKQSPDLKLSINGYTDNVGTHEYNVKLSQARAAAVVDALAKAGIAADRLSSAGFGDSNPIDDNGKPEGRAKNRRVELVRM
jgi:outer membrane protein OmpA-like peptidoglycan-associated protein